MTKVLIVRLADTIIWPLAGELAALLYFGQWLGNDNVLQTLVYLSPLMCWLASPVSGQYRSNWDEEGIIVICRRVLIGSIATSGCGIIFVYVLHQSHGLSRMWWGITLLLAFLMSSLTRVLVLALESRAGIQRHGKYTHNGKLRRVAILGCSRVASALIQQVMNDPGTGYRIEALLCDLAEADIHATEGVSKLQTLEQFETFIYRNHIREVWLIPDAERPYDWSEAIACLENTAATLRWFPVMPSYLTQKFELCAGTPSFELNAAAIDSDGRLQKAIFDRLFSMAILLALSPLLLAIAIAVKLSSPGPVIFKQLRHGVGGKFFSCLKFRTMMLHQERNTVTQATANDSRTTRVGRFLRKTSLDELPQFINVLRGDMSVVGPRPHAVEHNNYFSHEIKRYMSRHKVKPGITGWAQINGCRGETDTLEKMHRRVDFDIYYIRNWSFWLDIKIIFRTAFRGWFGKHVY